MKIVFENYTTDYFKNFSGQIDFNCQILSNRITLDKFIDIMMSVKYAYGKLIIDDQISNNFISKDRGIYIIDEFLLYNHLNVYDNLSLVLRASKMSPVTIDRKIKTLNKIVRVNLDSKIKNLDTDAILRLLYAKVILSESKIVFIKYYENYKDILNEKNIVKLIEMLNEDGIDVGILIDRKEKLIPNIPTFKLGKSSIEKI